MAAVRRLVEPIGYVPPAEFEAAYYRSQEGHAMVARLEGIAWGDKSQRRLRCENHARDPT